MVEEKSVKGFGEFRKHERHRLRGKVELSWAVSKDRSRQLIANCVDVSVYGMLIECPEALAPGLKLAANIPSAGVAGTAVVRHCRQNGPWFRV